MMPKTNTLVTELATIDALGTLHTIYLIFDFSTTLSTRGISAMSNARMDISILKLGCKVILTNQIYASSV